MDQGANYYSIDQFKEVCECVEEFVLQNIQDLVFLRINQTEFKDVVKK